MTVRELQEKLVGADPETEVVIRTHLKTGYDEGDIYESLDIDCRVQGPPNFKKQQVFLKACGQKLIGGW